MTNRFNVRPIPIELVSPKAMTPARYPLGKTLSSAPPRMGQAACLSNFPRSAVSDLGAQLLDRESGEHRAQLLNRLVQDLILLASQLLQGVSRIGGRGGKRGNQPAK